jgi:hypothetical protein
MDVNVLLMAMFLLIPIVMACLPIFMRKIDNILLVFTIMAVFIVALNHDLSVVKDPGGIILFPIMLAILLVSTTVTALIIIVRSPIRRIKKIKPYHYLNAVYYVIAFVGGLCILNYPETREAKVSFVNLAFDSQFQIVNIEEVDYGYSRITFQSDPIFAGKSFCYLPTEAANLLQDGQHYTFQKSIITRTCDRIRVDNQLFYGLYGNEYSYLLYLLVGCILLLIAKLIRMEVTPYKDKQFWR